MRRQILPPMEPQCAVCPWFMAFRSPNFCDGALVDKPSCWWECEGKPAMDAKVRLRQLITFREWCLAHGLTTEDGQWLFDLPQDWEWDGEHWTLRKAPNYEVVKRQLRDNLRRVKALTLA